jgi:hypothetical protein
MTKLKDSDHNDQSALIDDAKLDTVTGGMSFDQYRAQFEVGHWFMKDVFARPTLGRIS